MSTSTNEDRFQKVKRLLRYNETFSAYWLLLPFLVMTLLFKGWPTVWAPWMATQEYSLVGTEFVGLANFEALIARESFIQSVKVTVIIAFIRLPIAIGVGLLAAVAVNSVFIKHRSIWRTLFIAPIVVAPVIIAILARLFLEPQGIVDVTSNTLFGSQVLWLTSPLPAQFSVAFAGAYVDIAVCFIFFLAGLVGIDYDLYRAAKVDGADRIQQFRHVTIPQLRPIIALVLIFETNRALKMFAEPMVLTDGGQPGGATRTVVVLLYQQAFVELNLGFAAAIGVALTVIIAALMLIEYFVISE
jgi:ABC-type sugar transport system permease subunit